MSQNLEHRALSAAVSADNSKGFSLFYGKAHIIKRTRAAIVGEAYGVEFYDWVFLQFSDTSDRMDG